MLVAERLGIGLKGWFVQCQIMVTTEKGKSV